jgi:hormone-sensitive lipase
MNISLKELIIAGDSAGGNMALGICFRSIKLGIRVPDGLFLPYPVVNLNFKSFNPYLLNGLVD